MKNIVLFLMAYTFLVTAPKQDQGKLIGKWSADEKHQVGSLVFDENGFAYFEVANEIIGGEEFEMNGKKGSVRFEVNFLSTPVELDFIVTIFSTGEEKKLKCIIEFINENELKFATDFNEGRPNGFDEANTVIFHKTE